ncbi:MAG: ribonuclease H-like domain-containing protein [Bacteroidia bacterium]
MNNTELSIERILFLDIETCPEYESLQEVPPILQDYWLRQYNERRPKAYTELSSEEYFQMRAGIHALYARVVCISMGFFHEGNDGVKWRQMSIYDLDETKILRQFIEKWNSFKGYQNDKTFSPSERAAYGVCGHNIINFDIPFLGRRFLIRGVPLPDFWRMTQWAASWQLKNPTILDTMNLWGFTTRESSYISLEVLASALGIQFQKSLIPVEIHQAFKRWQSSQDEMEFLPVVRYCEADVRVTAEIYIRMQLPVEVQEAYIRALREYERKALASNTDSYESSHN